MHDDAALEAGREAFQLKRWGEVFARLSTVQLELHPDDLDLLATAAFLIGKEGESVEAFNKAHHGYLELGQPHRAARAAWRLGFQFMNRGDEAQASGWFARGVRVLDEAGLDTVERGYFLLPIAVGTMFGGDPAAAQPLFEQMGAYGERFGDADLTAMSRLGGGQCLMMLGNVTEGVALHDEAMLSVVSDEISPMVAGLIYCAVVESCHRIFDLRRAQEWTMALSRWCESQPDLVPFRGQCLVHRAEIMQLHGAWGDSFEEAERARLVLSKPPPQPAVGMAFYQLGEIHRLRGELTKAEEAYRKGNEFGRQPQPGLALLRLAQGQVDASSATIRRVLDETEDPAARCKILWAAVEIFLAAGDVAGARKAAGELAEISAKMNAPYVHAMSQHADGAVLLAEGDAAGSLASLRSAASDWNILDAPYEAAHGRILIGLACRALGDEDSAAMELDAARQTFARLGAVPASARLDELLGRAGAKTPGGLTAREVEVLVLVAAGKTNRGIANELVLSEKTVARHISNIFTKLGVSTRAAATAFAYEHDLV